VHSCLDPKREHVGGASRWAHTSPQHGWQESFAQSVIDTRRSRSCRVDVSVGSESPAPHRPGSLQVLEGFPILRKLK
jgi:hypothetical protein